jgi:predicted DNA-binding transcriptional regulator AlpA
MGTPATTDSGQFPLGHNGALDEPVVTERAAAKLCGLSVSTLRRLRHRQAGPPYMVLGRSIRYSLPTVRQWLAGQEVR